MTRDDRLHSWAAAARRDGDEESARALEDILREHQEDQGVIAVWRGRAERAEAAHAEANERWRTASQDASAFRDRCERAESAVSTLTAQLEEERCTVAELRRERDAARAAVAAKETP